MMRWPSLEKKSAILILDDGSACPSHWKLYVEFRDSSEEQTQSIPDHRSDQDKGVSQFEVIYSLYSQHN